MQLAAQANLKAKYILRSVLFCVAFTGLFVILSFAKLSVPANSERLAHGIIGTIAAFATTLLFLKFDKKKFSDIGLTFELKTIIRFFTGVLMGLVIMGLMAISVIYFASVEVALNPESNVWRFLLLTLPLIPLAFMEELGFRAYPLEIIKDRIGIRKSILLTSILFALYHVVNGWTIASSFYGPAVWGLVFGLAAVYSKGIALPTGIHYAANLTTSALGDKGNTVSIWNVKQSGEATTTYGGIHLTAILPGLVLLVLAIICIELYMRRKTTYKSTAGREVIRN